MNPPELVVLKRDCEATEIPSGKKITLFNGTELMITQALGGTFTVVTHMGLMASITGKDADAIGREVPAEVKAALEDAHAKPVEDLVWAQLRTCYDPEIPHNIVDLGLVYQCDIAELPEEKKRVDIRMTLTAPGCGMGEWIRQDVKNKMMAIPGVAEANVEVVFDPPWDRSRMAPALRREFM